MPIIIVGAGGHAIVVADALLAAGERVLGFTDADTRRHGTRICGLPVLGDDRVLARRTRRRCGWPTASAAWQRRGEPLRRSVQQRLAGAGLDVRGGAPSVGGRSRRSPASAPACSCSPRCVVQPGADVGAGCIVNTAAVVEHDVVLGDVRARRTARAVCGNVARRRAQPRRRRRGGAPGSAPREPTRSSAPAPSSSVTLPGRATLIGVPARAAGSQHHEGLGTGPGRAATRPCAKRCATIDRAGCQIALVVDAQRPPARHAQRRRRPARRCSGASSLDRPGRRLAMHTTPTCARPGEDRHVDPRDDAPARPAPDAGGRRAGIVVGLETVDDYLATPARDALGRDHGRRPGHAGSRN